MLVFDTENIYTAINNPPHYRPFFIRTTFLVFNAAIFDVTPGGRNAFMTVWVLWRRYARGSGRASGSSFKAPAGASRMQQVMSILVAFVTLLGVDPQIGLEVHRRDQHYLVILPGLLHANMSTLVAFGTSLQLGLVWNPS